MAVSERVYDHDPRSFWGLWRGGGSDARPPSGVTAILLLSDVGLAHLLAGTLNFADPQAEALVESDSAPAAIYIWVMFAPGIVSGALFSLFAQMNQPPYADADIYWRPVTAAGSRLTKPFGFKLLIGGMHPAELYVLERTRRDRGRLRAKGRIDVAGNESDLDHLGRLD